MNEAPRVPPSQLPPHPQKGEYKFVAVGWAVVQGSRRVAQAASRNMAMRIANALNAYIPNKTGR